MPSADINNVPLNSILVSKNVARALKQLFLSRKPDIDQLLQKAGYKRMDGSSKPAELAQVLIGINPDRKKIQSFPSICIFVSSREPSWMHWRATNDKVSVRLFCCVQFTENTPAEEFMYDFTEICNSILMSSPTLPFFLEEDGPDGEPAIFDHQFMTALPRITYGTLDGDYIRAGQIDWTGEVLLPHPNMLF